jgi:hypothetical protein
MHLKLNLKTRKSGMEMKGLKVNMTKTKLTVSDPDLNVLRDSGAFPYVVCRSRQVNFIQCSQCEYVRNIASSVGDLSSILTTSAQDAVAMQDLLMVDQSLK